MKKILLLLCILLGTVGTWATPVDVTVIDKTKDATTYGTLANGTFTTNTASGMADVTVSGVNYAAKVNDNYGYCLGCQNVSSGTVTMTAPEGYVIIGYSLTGRLNTSNFVFTLTPSAGGNAVALTTGGQTVSASGLEAQTASFSYAVTTNNTQGSTNTFYMPSLVITIGTAEEAAFAKSQFAAYNTVQGWIPTIQSAKGLVKDATNYISNAKSSAEGSYEALLDGEYTTYFHGAYGSQSVPNEDQYLQATLPNAVNAIYFYFKKRSQNNNNRPTSITISGSNDGSSFTDITTINSGLPTDASVLDYTSSKINLGASYQYLRFTVTSTNNGATHSNGHVFFTFSEFYILPSETEVDNVMDLRAALAGTAAINYTAQNISDVTAANTALLNTVVDVTYALYESDGTTLVSNTVVEQEKNSPVSIPSAISNYTYYDYTTEGTIGTEDCTIKVTRTLKSGYVISLDGLSNSKCYNIRNNRATWAVGSGATVVNSTYELGLAFSASDTKQQFAFITYEGNVYLYSVGESKFAYVDGNKLSLTADVTSAVAASPVTFQASTNGTYMYSEPIIVTVNGSHFGVSTGFSPDIYKYQSQGDGGNCAYIIEAGSFDATAALALLEEYFHPTNCYDRVEAEVLPFLMDGDNPSPTIGKPFGLSSTAATSIVTTYMTQLNNKQFTLAEYEAIVAAKNAGIIYPEDGKFYVIKNVSNSNYINVKSAGGIYADANIPTPGSIVKAVVRGGHTYFATQGKEFGWCYGTSNKALLDAAGSGKYAHFADITVPGQIAFAHCIGNGEGPTYEGYLANSYYTVGENNQVCGGVANAPAAQWTFEEATSINVTVSSAGYATLYVPFAVTIPSGIKAYAVSGLSGNLLTLAEIETTIPAGTPVILEGGANTYTFDITTGGSYEGDNKLEGTYLQKAADNGSYILQNQSGKVGFYLVDTDTATPNVPANRAYLPASAAGVKAFFFGDTEDAIQSVISGTASAEIYNLAGQRVNKLQRGVNIVNGKKVLVK